MQIQKLKDDATAVEVIDKVNEIIYKLNDIESDVENVKKLV